MEDSGTHGAEAGIGVVEEATAIDKEGSRTRQQQPPLDGKPWPCQYCGKTKCNGNFLEQIFYDKPTRTFQCVRMDTREVVRVGTLAPSFTLSPSSPRRMVMRDPDGNLLAVWRKRLMRHATKWFRPWFQHLVLNIPATIYQIYVPRSPSKAPVSENETTDLILWGVVEQYRQSNGEMWYSITPNGRLVFSSRFRKKSHRCWQLEPRWLEIFSEVCDEIECPKSDPLPTY